jgi:hypothetical protein
VRELEHRRGRTGACALQLLNGLFAIAKLLERGLDLGVIRDLALDGVDVRRQLLIVLQDLLELVLLRLEYE